MWNDSRQNLTILSLKQRQEGAVVQDSESRVHPHQDALESGRCSTAGRRLRELLQHGPLAQCDRLHYAGGPAGWSRRGNLGREEAEVGDGRRQEVRQDQGEEVGPATVL
jgi:hypothetical protein